MKLKFSGKTMPEYQGHDGNGGELKLAPGDSCEVSDSVGSALLRHYRRDFETCDEDKEHAPDSNKMATKTAKFKSK